MAGERLAQKPDGVVGAHNVSDSALSLGERRHDSVPPKPSNP